MKEEDIKHLEWMYKRLKRGETVSVIKFKTIIDSLKPAMKETKYKLVIPDEVPKEYMHGYTNIYDNAEVKVLSEFSKDAMLVECKGKTYDIPKSWLVEVPAERPYKSPREWLHDKYPGSMPAHNYSHGALMNAFIDGREDNELKHRETESFTEFMKRESVIKEDTPEYTAHEYTWRKALESRGYE